jgi:cell division protein ZapA (FtsZ GTPase activity inhibitor)
MKLKTFKVNISDIEYTLTGDDETLMRKAAYEVSSQIEVIKNQHSIKLSSDTLSVLAALNIAEREIQNSTTAVNQTNHINEELTKMVQQLNQILL